MNAFVDDGMKLPERLPAKRMVEGVRVSHK
jgi:hypothetical protein